MEAMQSSTDGSKHPKGAAPPDVITVDTGGKGEAPCSKGPDAASQARTPKHANKQSDEARDEKASPTMEDGQQGSYGYPSRRSFDERAAMPGGSAFQPHGRHSFPPQQRGSQPMQVSPGAGRYFSSYSGPSNPRYGPPPAHHYEHHYQQGPPSFQQRAPYGGPPHNNSMYSGQQQQYQGYDSAGPSWGPHQSYQGGGPPPGHIHARPPAYPPNHPHAASMHDPYSRLSGAAVSRAVSNSFDRSIEKGHSKHHGGNVDVSPHLGPAAHDQASLPGDASWGQLNQVASVDEDEMRKRLARSTKRHSDDASETSKEMALHRAHSNSSSLTNSPTEGVEKLEINKKTKLPSSLDSLSSVASVQAPLDEKEKMKEAACKLSPSGGSEHSLDLMKCGSGSSALLLPGHARHETQFSFSSAHEPGTGKRSHVADDVREEMDTKEDMDDAELRKAPSEEMRPSSKKVRLNKESKKTSPLSIACSPPSSPSKLKNESKLMKSPHMSTTFSKEPTSCTIDSFYGKAPSYSYSLETAPLLPRHPDAPLSRPGSSTSTMTPMNVDTTEGRCEPGVGQAGSWELAPQDSFGAVSAGNALMSSFSFTQDYPMLAASASHEHGQSGHHPNLPPPHHMHPHQALESRNQSFEGGHYHGSFNRSDSMMSYEGHPPMYEGRGPGYQGSYPPHAGSWGSAGSYQGYGGHNQYQNYPPPMMRNYSEDSGRASPPSGPHGVRMMHSHGRQFQPPPEFRAPPSMVNKAGPQRPTHILSSPYGGKSSSFGWTKDEDIRLTEIMKKYKNPRDWEPIAKELNCGRSAKECHERWIRYLKPGVRKGQWTDHEDAIVIEAVGTSSEQPFTRWSDLAQRLPGRVGKQIRDRWVNHLNPNINHLPFAREDDLLLWEGHKKLGKRWVEISNKYFNCSRSENHIKNRWYSASFKKFITNEFGSDAYSGGKASKESPSKKKKDSRPPSVSSPTKRQQSNQSPLQTV